MSKEKPQVKKRLYTRLMDVYRHNDIYIPGFNTITRNLLKAKAESDFATISHKQSVESEAISEWIAAKNLFFGYGVFRSGTTFLADFLNRSTSRTAILHEANVNDYWYYTKAIHSENEAVDYVKNYRLAEIYFRLKGLDIDTYGEINPFLRRHVLATQQAIPGVKQFQIVRNPQNVLRSLMSRELFDRKDPMAVVIYPPKSDEYSEKWPSMSRFEKLCWLWSADNRYIRENTNQVVKFEDLRTDFDYFDEKVLRFLDLKMEADTWKSEMLNVFNSTPRYTFPKYSDWSTEYKSQFDKICGPEMVNYGY